MYHEDVLYLGIDFVLQSRKPLDPLIAELKKFVIFNKDWRGIKRVTIGRPLKNPKPDLEIIWFCRLVKKLSPQSKKCWHACSSRLIDIGIESGTFAKGKNFQPLELKIKPATLRMISDIKAEIMITVYPKDIDESPLFDKKGCKKVHIPADIVHRLDEHEDRERHDASL